MKLKCVNCTHYKKWGKTIGWCNLREIDVENGKTESISCKIAKKKLQNKK